MTERVIDRDTLMIQSIPKRTWEVRSRTTGYCNSLENMIEDVTIYQTCHILMKLSIPLMFEPEDKLDLINKIFRIRGGTYQKVVVRCSAADDCDRRSSPVCPSPSMK